MKRFEPRPCDRCGKIVHKHIYAIEIRNIPPRDRRFVANLCDGCAETFTILMNRWVREIEKEPHEKRNLAETNYRRRIDV